jgi:hypothetical protein
MGQIEVAIPRMVEGQKKEIPATISEGKWKSEDKGLEDLLNCLHLDTGHHSDRDLEMAQMVGKYLGGTVQDNRKKPSALEKLPR